MRRRTRKHDHSKHNSAPLTRSISAPSSPSPFGRTHSIDRNRSVSICNLQYELLPCTSVDRDSLDRLEVIPSVLVNTTSVIELIPYPPLSITRSTQHFLSSIRVNYGPVCIHVGHDSIKIECGRHMTLKYEFIVGSRESVKSWKRVCYKNWHDLLIVSVATINKVLAPP